VCPFYTIFQYVKHRRGHLILHIFCCIRHKKGLYILDVNLYLVTLLLTWCKNKLPPSGLLYATLNDPHCVNMHSVIRKQKYSEPQNINGIILAV
jgi:hypothetical protein